MNVATLFDQLKTIRDNLKLRSHLFELEIKDEWHLLEKKLSDLEARLMQRARQLGVAEEHYFVGSDEEIKTLVKEFNDLSQKTKKN